LARAAKLCFRAIQCTRRRQYPGIILEDYSRYIIAWKLYINMRAGDVTDTLEMRRRSLALVQDKPCLLIIDRLRGLFWPCPALVPVSQLI